MFSLWKGVYRSLSTFHGPRIPVCTKCNLFCDAVNLDLLAVPSILYVLQCYEHSQSLQK